MGFRLWLEAKAEELSFMRNWFDSRMDNNVLRIFGDWYEDQGDAMGATALHAVADKVNLKRKRGQWCGGDIRMFFFHKARESWPKWANPSREAYPEFVLNRHHHPIWYLILGPWGGNTLHPRTVPNGSIYRISLRNGEWSVFESKDRYAQVLPKGRSRGQWDAQDIINHQDFRRIGANDVPDDVLAHVFWEILNQYCG